MRHVSINAIAGRGSQSQPLHRIQVEVPALTSKEIVVPASLNDFAMIHYCDLIRVYDDAEPVCNHKRRAVAPASTFGA